MFDDLKSRLTPDALAWLDAAGERCAREGVPALLEAFPAVPRRAGRAPAADEAIGARVGSAPRIDLAAFRVCDLAAGRLWTASKGGSAALRELWRHGDVDERIMALRCLPWAPLDEGSIELIEEAHRTNIEACFQALVCDSDLAARAAAHPRFDIAGFNRLMLKAAFLGLPLSRLIDAPSHANAELSRMLQDLASEREAAGRAVWFDTWHLIALAPTEGSVARVVGGLEHGDDRVRLAAARGLLALNRKDLAAFARERLPREPREEVRRLLAQAV